MRILTALVLGCEIFVLHFYFLSCSSIAKHENFQSSNFLELSCNDITKAVLKRVEKNETNFIFSPFGYSVILGLLAEGSENSTKEELAKILHLPEKLTDVRLKFKTTLERLQDKSSSKPEFRNYFYVYKNFTISNTFKKILLENYFTEIKSVERVDYNDDWETTTASNVQDESSKIKREKRVHSRIKRLAKRFLGIDLEHSPKSELSSLSVNRVYTGNVTKRLSRMLIFNGLYFKGLWKVPFQHKQGEDLFFTATEKVSTKMMLAVGQFAVGQLPELDSVAVKIPYQGERYSFVIILPNSKDGIFNLLAGLPKLNLKEFSLRLEPRHIQISIPTFQFRTTSDLKESLNDLGVREIFTSEANLSGISENSGLFVDDIVQLVTINVDNDAATPNFLTASSVQTRTVTEKFTADHPFLFFVQDHKENLIIASGVLHRPTKEED